jgi:hypothetical protein
VKAAMTDLSFKQRIQQRYPEGLTGVFAIGGTRTTYILEQNRFRPDPGNIEDFSAHGEYILSRYWQFAEMFFDLGGQNMIITAFSFRGFYNRGVDYAALTTQEMRRFIDDGAVDFYRRQNVDPYFAGYDTLLLQPEDSPLYRLGQQLVEFQRQWSYQDGRHKLVWEIASIPLYTFWQTFQHMTPEEREQLDAEITAQDNLEEVYRILYNRFSKVAYGTDIPMPHFYLGTNKSGDLKWRSPLPMALSGGDYLRMFYTPYPTLFIRRETLQTILEDLAFNNRFHSAKTDYGGQYTSELAQTEYERVMSLSADPETTLGLARKVTT